MLYGSNSGLTAAGDQLWHQNQAGVNDQAAPYEGFSSSLGAGDFDGDGRDDLAIGVQYERVDNQAAAGGVNVLYGSASGLTATGDQFWTQNTPGVRGVAESASSQDDATPYLSGDHFGNALGVGDFDGDGRDDLAIGVVGEDVGSIWNAGQVNVLYGSNAGLTATGDQVFHQNTAGVQGVAESGDRFGSSLATGDFNGDGRDDLAVGVTGEDIGSIENAGAVNVLYGSNSGLRATNDQIWHQNSNGVRGVAEEGDLFGASLGVGDFNGDGRDDLAIGSAFEDVGNVANAGAVNVLYGSNSGLTAVGDQIWTQDSAGVQGAVGANHNFGDALGVGDFNNDGYDDLAISIPGQTISGLSRAGAVTILFGSANGLVAN